MRRAADSFSVSSDVMPPSSFCVCLATRRSFVLSMATGIAAIG